MDIKTQAVDIGEVIRARRTQKPDKLNGRKINDETINELLALADWAPTHARTEPWRFIVYAGDKVGEFTNHHADLFREHTPEESFNELKYDNIKKLGNNVSHIIIAWMKRIPTHKIPEIEEVSATAAAIQTLLLAATSKGISSFWSTGGMAHSPVMRKELRLSEEDRVLGILYLGYSDEPLREGIRMIPLSEKIEWIK